MAEQNEAKTKTIGYLPIDKVQTLKGWGEYVDKSTKVLSYAPWPRCPGRHWNIKAAWDNLFGKSEPPPPPAAAR